MGWVTTYHVEQGDIKMRNNCPSGMSMRNGVCQEDNETFEYPMDCNGCVDACMSDASSCTGCHEYHPTGNCSCMYVPDWFGDGMTYCCYSNLDCMSICQGACGGASRGGYSGQRGIGTGRGFQMRTGGRIRRRRK